MILELHPDVALTVARQCGRLGWHANVVGSSADLRDALPRWRPRAVIVGVSLPGPDALEPLRLVAAHDANLPVLCVVEHIAGDTDASAAFRVAGVPRQLHYAEKPLRRTDLARFLRSLE